MMNRKFYNEKLQDIYNAEFAKEIAKLDAQQNEKENKSIMGWVFFIVIISTAVYYIFTRLFLSINLLKTV